MSASKRFHLEIEVDNVDSDERMSALTEAFQIFGGQVAMQFVLIAGDNPKPEVTMWCEDFEDGKTAISMDRPDEEGDE